MDEMLNAALGYAARGWRVLPVHNVIWSPSPDGMAARCSCGRKCGTPGKHPRIRGGFRSASSELDQIRAWWTKWPSANIGIATGEASNLTVLDLDGAEGLAELTALIDPAQLSTLAAQTGSGAHLYFQHSGERSSARGKLHVRAAGGYVIAPPSNHQSGRTYRWLTQSPPSSLPPPLKAYCDAGAEPATPAPILPAAPVWLQSYTPNSVSLSTQITNNISTPWTAHEEARLRSALSAIPADSYEPWYQYGMALQRLGWIRSDGSDAGFDIWDTWSQSCASKYAPSILEEKWLSFGKITRTGREITIASVYHDARERGWDARSTMQAEAAAQPQKMNGVHSLPEAFNGSPQGFAFAQQSFAAGGSNAIIFPDVDKSGRPKATCQNTRAAIRGLGLESSYDRFHDRYFLGGKPIGEWAGEFTDSAVQALRSVVHEVYGFDPGSQPAYDAGVQEGLQHAFDPVAEYLDGLHWDGAPRLATWLHRYLGTDDTPLNRAFGTLVLVAAVRRTFQPGAKFDQILVLEGPEGKNKSTAIELLADAAGPGNYSDSTILTLDDRGQQEAVAGVWLYEIADLTGISKAEVERVKAFASRRVDRARPAYGRTRQDRPRRCVFFATTNHDTYLKSQTGNRRFWPVRTGRVDVDALGSDRDMLWAEARAMERSGLSIALPERYWVDAAELQDMRREGDPWDDILERVAGEEHQRPDGTQRTEYRITSRDLLDLKLRLPIEKQTDATAKRLAACMRRLGWEGPKVYRTGDSVARGYTRIPRE